MIGAKVVDPEIFGPGCLAGFPTLEEEGVGLNALGVENTGREAEKGVDVATFEEFATNGFAGAPFEEDVVR